ncbi:hypothetical protein ACLKA6_005564 [Drosophila palustris]
MSELLPLQQPLLLPAVGQEMAHCLAQLIPQLQQLASAAPSDGCSQAHFMRKYLCPEMDSANGLSPHQPSLHPFT